MTLDDLYLSVSSRALKGLFFNNKKNIPYFAKTSNSNKDINYKNKSNDKLNNPLTINRNNCSKRQYSDNTKQYNTL